MPTRTLVRAFAAGAAPSSAPTARTVRIFSRRIHKATAVAARGCALRSSSRMRAAYLEAPGRPLVVSERPDPPPPGPGQVLLEVGACGVCRTDLHLVDGE